MTNDHIQFALDLFTLEELLEMCNIDPLEVLTILVDEGYIEFPPFLKQIQEEDESTDE